MGGALTTLSKANYKRGKLLRWYGIDREAKVIGDSRIEVDIPEWGYKFHMNDISATIGLSQISKVGNILKKHRDNAKYYLKNIDNIFYQHPLTKWKQDSSFWLYTLVLPSAKTRSDFSEFMKKNGVSTSRVHRRNDDYSGFPKSRSSLDGVKYFYDREICIPVHWAITKKQREMIAKLCNEFAKIN